MVSKIYVDLIIKNAGELLTLSPSFKEESGLGMIQNGAAAIEKGRIFWVGKTEELSGKFSLNRDGREMDADGKSGHAWSHRCSYASRLCRVKRE